MSWPMYVSKISISFGSRFKSWQSVAICFWSLVDVIVSGNGAPHFLTNFLTASFPRVKLLEPIVRTLNTYGLDSGTPMKFLHWTNSSIAGWFFVVKISGTFLPRLSLISTIFSVLQGFSQRLTKMIQFLRSFCYWWLLGNLQLSI